MAIAPFGTEVAWNVQLHSNSDATHELTIKLHNLTTAINNPLLRNLTFNLPDSPITDWRVQILKNNEFTFPTLWGYNEGDNTYNIALDYLHDQLGNVSPLQIKLDFRQQNAVQPFGTGGLYRLDCQSAPALKILSAFLFLYPPKLNKLENAILWLIAKARKKEIFDMFHINWTHADSPINVNRLDTQQAIFSGRRICPEGVFIFQKVALIELIPILLSILLGIGIGVIGNYIYDLLIR